MEFNNSGSCSDTDSSEWFLWESYSTADTVCFWFTIKNQFAIRNQVIFWESGNTGRNVFDFQKKNGLTRVISLGNWQHLSYSVFDSLLKKWLVRVIRSAIGDHRSQCMFLINCKEPIHKCQSFKNQTPLVTLHVFTTKNQLIRIICSGIKQHWSCCVLLICYIAPIHKSHSFRNRTTLIALYVFDSL